MQLTPRSRSVEIVTLIYAVFAAGLCSIVYELLIATTVVYFLGDSITYFSITIGLYMAAMGVGAFLSKYLTGDLLLPLVKAEVTLGLLGGLSVPALYLAYSHTDFFLHIYVVFTIAIGLLIGLEIPFLTRLLERYDNLRVSIAHVLTLDYLGALIATIAFPLLLLPFFGIFRSGLILGLINMTIGLLLLWGFPQRIGKGPAILFKGLSLLIIILIIGGLVSSQYLLARWNQSVYSGRILYTTRTPYQEIVLTKFRDDLRLYLNGHLQFSSQDEHRYHEALIHVPQAFLHDRPRSGLKQVLVLGGGDGMAVRELLKYSDVGSITLVDLDPAVIKLALENPYVRAINGNSLNSDLRVKIKIGDAFSHLKERGALYDLIVADLPDPNNTDMARLYSREFYRLIRANLTPGGVFVTQSTSPYYAGKAFWTIRATLSEQFAHTAAYHLLVPSFGDWGFVIASNEPLDIDKAAGNLISDTSYLEQSVFPGLFKFGKDMIVENDEISTLDRPIILNHYLEGWRRWGR